MNLAVALQLFFLFALSYRRLCIGEKFLSFRINIDYLEQRPQGLRSLLFVTYFFIVSCRHKMVVRLQKMMQSHCEEALSLLVANTVNLGVENTLNDQHRNAVSILLSFYFSWTDPYSNLGLNQEHPACSLRTQPVFPIFYRYRLTNTKLLYCDVNSIARLSKSAENKHDPLCECFLAFRKSSNIASVWITVFCMENHLGFFLHKITKSKAGNFRVACY